MPGVGFLHGSQGAGSEGGDSVFYGYGTACCSVENFPILTDSIFRASLDFYTRHPELYDTIHARAIRSLDGEFTEQ